MEAGGGTGIAHWEWDIVKVGQKSYSFCEILNWSEGFMVQGGSRFLQEGASS